MNRILLFVVMSLLCSTFSLTAQNLNSVDFAMQIKVVTTSNPKPTVTLSWATDPKATKYIVIRKLKNDPYFKETDSIILPANSLSYSDTSVKEGIVYEYQVCKNAKDSLFNRIAIGYVATGINIYAIENRGKVLILVDSSFATQLAPKLDRFESVLTRDGWYPVRKSVPRAESFDKVKVEQTKSIIDNEYANSIGGQLEALFIVGRVAVPYSGAFKSNTNYSPPDGHPDHGGAWPADVYYGDIVDDFGSPAMLSWSDQIVDMSATNADSNAVKARKRNENVPGDGKFDNTVIPSKIELQVGRIDFYDLPVFSDKTELELLVRYFDKNYAYKTGQVPVNYKGIVDDNFGAFVNNTGNYQFAESFSGTGWRNFASILGPDSVKAGKLFAETETDQHLFSYGTGGGTFTSAGGVGNSTDFATKKPKSIFMTLFGSYFGDWDHQNAFMRSAIASDPQVLTCFWPGRPHWFFHHMTVGETMGYATRLSQNNYSSSNVMQGLIMAYYGMGISLVNPVNGQLVSQGAQHFGGNLIHIALLGDPTLRIYEVEAPSTLTAVETDNGVVLQWSAPKENIDGYSIYRSSDPKGNFKRVGLPFYSKNNLTFVDTDRTPGTKYYMVKAVRKTRLNGKGYYNESLGDISAPIVVTSVQNTDVTESININVMPNPIENSSVISVESSSTEPLVFSLIDISGRVIATKEFYGNIGLNTFNFESLTKKESLQSGAYILRCTTSFSTKTIPVILQR